MDLPSHPSGPWKAFLLTASLLSYWSLPGDTQLAIDISTPTPMVGQNILLFVRGIQRESQVFSWYRGLGNQNLILSYNVSSQTQDTGPRFTQREVLYTNASLLIKNLMMTDAGSYTFQEVRQNLFTVTATRQLQVFRMVSKPRIRANTTSITEAKGSVAFTCLSKDYDITILWYLNNKAIPQSKRFLLSQDNKILTLLEPRREDAGYYQCEVWNRISAQSSDHITLAVNYGPDHVKITQEPGSEVVHFIKINANSTLTLRCQADSYPSAQYSWIFNGSMIMKDRDNLKLEWGSWVPGNYTCTAWNSLTKHFTATSVSVELLTEPSDLSHPGSSHFSYTAVSIIVVFLVMGALLCVLGAFLCRRARGYSQEVLEGPDQKEKNLPSMKYSEFYTYENGLQLQHETPNKQMVTPGPNVEPNYFSFPNAVENPYQDVDPYSTLSPDLKENDYQTLTFASAEVYEQITPKEAHQEKDEDLQD